MRSLFFHILLFLVLATPLLAQVDTTRSGSDTTGVARTEAPRGSAGAPDSAGRSSRTPAPGVYVMTKDPLTATLLSIVAGGGQLYTEQYIKAPIFFGVAAFFVGNAIYNHGLFIDYAEQYDAAPENSTGRAEAKRFREFYRDRRDLNAAYFVGVTLLSMIDAYVGAHLYDFDVDDVPGRDAEGTTSKIYVDPFEHRVGFWLRF